MKEAEILAGHISALANTGGGKIFIGMKKRSKGGIPLKDDRRISILEKLFLYRL